MSRRGTTRTGRPAALPEGAYDAPPLVVDGVEEHEGPVVRFHGEDRRSITFRVDLLPLPGWHRPLAAALAARIGPAGGRRTRLSATTVWGVAGRVVRFLSTLPAPPVTPVRLAVSHMEAFQRFRGASIGEIASWHELCEFKRLLVLSPLREHVPTDVVDYCGRRLRIGSRQSKPAYSEREFTALVSAARSDAANIRDRVRAGERLLARFREDPSSLETTERDRAALLDQAARTGMVTRGAGPSKDWVRQRLAVAGGLFLTRADLAPLLTLFVEVTDRNVETIKELSAEHRVLENRAVELRVVKRRRGQRRWHETVTWEIGKPGRELHTAGGLYLLVLELTARSRAFGETNSLWAVWRNAFDTGSRGPAEHYGMFEGTLARNLYASDWAAGHGLTADRPPPGVPERDQDGQAADPPKAVPLLVDFNRLKTSTEVRRTRQMGGHLPSSIRTNTIPTLFASYLRDDPTVVEWAQDIVGDALADAEQSALAAHRRAAQTNGGHPKVVPGPADAQHLHQAGLDRDTARRAADGELGTAWTGCVDHDHHPATGTRCRASFLDCFHCGNCLITRNDLPDLLGLLDALAARRHLLSENDWWDRYGSVWAALRLDVLVKFSPAEIEHAEAVKPDDALLDLVENPWEQP